MTLYEIGAFDFEEYVSIAQDAVTRTAERAARESARKAAEQAGGTMRGARAYYGESAVNAAAGSNYEFINKQEPTAATVAKYASAVTSAVPVPAPRVSAPAPAPAETQDKKNKTALYVGGALLVGLVAFVVFKK